MDMVHFSIVKINLTIVSMLLYNQSFICHTGSLHMVPDGGVTYHEVSHLQFVVDPKSEQPVYL